MTRIAIGLTLSLSLILSGCGASKAFQASATSHAQGIDGIWTAQARDLDGHNAMVFQTLMKQSQNSQVNVKMFSFLIPDPCFPEQTSREATFTQTGIANGNITGSFAMTVVSTFSNDNNTLTLAGTMNGPDISGTWSMSSVSDSCHGSGTFQMLQLPTT
jgi:hypothetical protein